MSAPAELLCDNRFADGAITATTTAAGYDAANIASLRTAEQWLSADTTTQYLTVDCGAVKSADGFGLISNLHLVGASVAVECSADNFAADTTIAYPATAVTQSVMFPSFANQDKQQWRLAITGLTAPGQILKASIGQRFVFDGPIEGEFSPAVEHVMPANGLPDKGQVLELLAAYTRLSARARFSLVDDVWYRETFLPVWDSWLIKFKPFFWAPNRTLRPDDAYWMWVDPAVVLDAAYHPRTWKRRFELPLQGVKL